MHPAPLTNPDLPDGIRAWRIDFDPYGLTERADWLQAAEKTEDILQLSHRRLPHWLIDVGFYRGAGGATQPDKPGVYRMVIVRDQDWDAPHQSFESPSAADVAAHLYRTLAWEPEEL